MFILSYTEHDVDKRHPLAEGETSVGRSPGCRLIVDDPGISRRHAAFIVTDGGCRVRDLGSRNGTYRNGEIVSDTEIADGDTVMLGHLRVQISYSRDDQVSLSEAQTPLTGETVYRSILPATSLGPAQVESKRLLELLAEIARTLVDVTDLNDILEKVAELVFTATAAERCVLLLSDEDAPLEELTPRVARCRDGSTPDNLSVSRTILSTVTRDQVAMLAANAQTDARLEDAESVRIMAKDLRSFMCTPLWNRRAVIGAIYADTPLAERFTEAELELFTALAEYAAMAIDRARLTTRVQQEQQRRARLERYHSPAVVERILDAGTEGDVAFIAQELDVSILFADIVGFTPCPDALPEPGAIYIDGIRLPFYASCGTSLSCIENEAQQRPSGSSAGSVLAGTMIVTPRPGRQAPEGYLIGPRPSPEGELTLDDVTRIVDQAVAQANRTRAQNPSPRLRRR